ncbi:MAG TPA: DUF4340 domain-containing protein [Candidatus Dormibacteraeota bacterium]|nr:DUF4340 domain-containing protein [Candidatus Dormibacteraeota bacterium]
MRARYTALLALILVGLGAYLYFVESKQEAESEKKKTLLAVKADDVTGLTLTYGDHEIVLEQRDGAWRMTKPVEAAADELAVKNLVRAIAEAEVKKTIDDPPQDLLPFGLAPPFVTIAITTKDGAAVPAVKVGKTTAVSFSTYVQLADKPTVYLTPSSFRSGVDKQPKDLRDKTILAFNDNDITALTLRGDGGAAVELARKNGEWWIEQPASYRADNNAVRALLSTIRNLRATDFANDNPAPADLATYGLAPPQRELVLRAGADKTITLDVGKPTDQGLYVKSGERPTAFVVGKWVASDLGKGVNELRDKTLLTFDPTAAGSIAVTRADGANFTLASKDGQWTLAGAEAPTNPASALAFVGALSRLAGSQVLAESTPDPAAYGLAAPAITVNVTGTDGKSIGTVRLGTIAPDPPATQYTAQRDGDPAVMQLGEFQFKQLDKKPDDFTRPPKPPAGAPGMPGMPGGDAGGEDEGEE